MTDDSNLKIEVQGFIEPDTALDSLRHSDFDCYSAYGEVVDNSIQAKANDIRLEFEEVNDSKSTKKRILQIEVGKEKNIKINGRLLSYKYS